MVGIGPKAIALTGVSVLCLSLLPAYDFMGLSGRDGPTAALLWIFVGSGFVLTCGGLVAATLQLDIDRRKTLAFSLLLFGVISFALALFVAHVGPVLLILALPAMFCGAVVGMLALPFHRLRSKRRLQ